MIGFEGLQKSAIALVNPASPNSPPPTAFTYDPSGMPTLSGQLNNFPFLYQGMEHKFLEPNQFYYGGDGQFYSAQIQRGFSIAGAQSTSGPGGPGPRRAHHGRHHGGGGRGRGAAVNGHTDVAATADVVAAGGGDTGSSGGTPSSLPGLLEDIYNFFSDLFGGGGGQSLPPNYFVYQARLQRARRHPQYPEIDGVAIDIVLNQSPAAPEFCADPHPCAEPPLTRTGSPAPCMACGCTACATIPMTVTGYDNGYESTGKNPGDPAYGITASGSVAGAGTIAAPNRFGYGTKMFVPGYGCGQVEDRGGAITGNHIDLWFPSVTAARGWGLHRNVPVSVCQ